MTSICSIVLSSALIMTPPNEDKIDETNCYKIPQLVKEPIPWYKKHRKKTYEFENGGELTFSLKRKEIISYKKTW